MVLFSPCDADCCPGGCTPVSADFDSGAYEWPAQFYLYLRPYCCPETIPSTYVDAQLDPEGVEGTICSAYGYDSAKDVLEAVKDGSGNVTHWTSYQLDPTRTLLTSSFTGDERWKLVPTSRSVWKLYAGGDSTPSAVYTSVGTPNRFKSFPRSWPDGNDRPSDAFDRDPDIVSRLGCTVFELSSYNSDCSNWPPYLWLTGCFCEKCFACNTCEWEKADTSSDDTRCCREPGVKVTGITNWSTVVDDGYGSDARWEPSMCDDNLAGCGTVCYEHDDWWDPWIPVPSSYLDSLPYGANAIWNGPYAADYELIPSPLVAYAPCGSSTDSIYLPACRWPLGCSGSDTYDSKLRWQVELEYRHSDDKYRAILRASNSMQYSVPTEMVWATDFFARSSPCRDLGTLNLDAQFTTCWPTQQFLTRPVCPACCLGTTSKEPKKGCVDPYNSFIPSCENGTIMCMCAGCLTGTTCEYTYISPGGLPEVTCDCTTVCPTQDLSVATIEFYNPNSCPPWLA